MKPFILPFLAFIWFFPTFLAGQSLIGKWTIDVLSHDGGTVAVSASINADGTYSMDFGKDGSIDVKGKYELVGNQITMWDISGELACPSDLKGDYLVYIKGNEMTMSLLEDECVGRGRKKMIWKKN